MAFEILIDIGITVHAVHESVRTSARRHWQTIIIILTCITFVTMSEVFTFTYTAFIALERRGAKLIAATLLATRVTKSV